MHLGNGDLYKGKERTPYKRLRKALLLEFRDRLTQKNASIPPPTTRGLTGSPSPVPLFQNHPFSERAASLYIRMALQGLPFWGQCLNGDRHSMQEGCLSEVFLTSGRQLAPEYASMAWIGFSGKKPVAA